MFKNVIPIVLSTDDTYVFPTAVTISSILSNAEPDTYYNIYILVSQGCMDCCTKTFDLLKSHYKNFDINYITMDNKAFSKAKVYNPHVKTPTYYRLLSAELLKQHDRCICLDSDILVNEDLSGLYNMDIEGCYIAGVKSWDDQQPNEANIRHMEAIGLPDMNQYIYLGVLLMDLAQIRKDAMTQVFMEHMDKGYRSDDQDVFNVCCYNKIFFLPLRYNLLMRFYQSPAVKGVPVHSAKEWQDAQQCPAIFHYPGRIIKPWINRRVKESKLWWNYAAVYEDTPEYHYYREESEKWAAYIDWKYFIRRLQPFGDIAIFGFSAIGKSLMDNLEKCGCNTIRCFYDNDLSKQEEVYRNVPVCTPGELEEDKGGLAVIISSQLFYKEIKKQLKDMEKPECRIVTYIHKSRLYFKSIDKDFYELELKEIYLKETGSNDYFEQRGYEKILEELKNGTMDVLGENIKKKYWLDEWLI